jgi:8-oxo-dGTP diphosphatase
MKPCALGIVFSPDRSKILLIKRKDLAIWVLPGGGIDEGEEPMLAAHREVYEEAGIKVVFERLASLYVPKNRLSSTTYIFEGCFGDGEVKPGDEATDAGFFPIYKLPKVMFPLHQIWIDRILTEPKKTIKGIITEINFKRTFSFLIRHPWILIRYAIHRLIRS